MKKIFIFATVTFIALLAQAQANESVPMAELTDKQIAKVVLTISEGEMDAAKIARVSNHQEVREFANMMMEAHKENSKQTKDIAKNQKLSPEKSNTSKMLEQEIFESNKDLKRQSKNKFDRAYLEQQIALNEKALNTFDTVLIPQVKNTTLKAQLEKTRESISQHLAEAQILQLSYK